MHEATLVDETCTVTLVDLRHGRKIEVLRVKTDDAIIIDGLPATFIDDTVTESIEAFLTDIVPTHLRHPLGFLGLFIHEGFQQLVLLLLLEKAEISLTFNLVLETVELGDIHLAQLNGLTDAIFILQLEDSGRILVLGN